MDEAGFKSWLSRTALHLHSQETLVSLSKQVERLLGRDLDDVVSSDMDEAIGWLKEHAADYIPEGSPDAAGGRVWALKKYAAYRHDTR